MKTKRRSVKPDAQTTYKVICISMYKKDLEDLDTIVRDLRTFGYKRASRSWLIRFALSRVRFGEAANALSPARKIPSQEIDVVDVPRSLSAEMLNDPALDSATAIPTRSPQGEDYG